MYANITKQFSVSQEAFKLKRKVSKEITQFNAFLDDYHHNNHVSINKI